MRPYARELLESMIVDSLVTCRVVWLRYFWVELISRTTSWSGLA
jgi:hypothetical protein